MVPAPTAGGETRCVLPSCGCLLGDVMGVPTTVALNPRHLFADPQRFFLNSPDRLFLAAHAFGQQSCIGEPSEHHRIGRRRVRRERIARAKTPGHPAVVPIADSGAAPAVKTT